jgi:hypothetical protein
MPLKGREKVDRAIGDIYINTNDLLRGIYLKGLAEITVGTPVDTGRVRNNWFLSAAVPSSNTTTSKSKGLSTIRSLRGMPTRVLNKKIYYTNNLPYAATLEYGGFPDPVKKGTWNKKKKKYEKRSAGGFSKQAPTGWVRAILINMQNKIRAL